MKTKLSLLAAALLFAFTTIQAENEITIGVIQYDLSDIDKSFKDLHDQGFGSCEINYRSNTLTKEFAEQVKAASKKHQIKVTTVVGVPGSKSVWLEFSAGTCNDRFGSDRRKSRKDKSLP